MMELLRQSAGNIGLIIRIVSAGSVGAEKPFRSSAFYVDIMQ